VLARFTGEMKRVYMDLSPSSRGAALPAFLA